MELINSSQNGKLASNVVIANTSWSRTKGLLGRKSLQNEALILSPCNSIHSCFMSFKFDVIFIDKDGRVIHLIERMKPFRFSPIIRKAWAVIELPVGVIQSSGTRIGDMIKWR